MQWEEIELDHECPTHGGSTRWWVEGIFLSQWNEHNTNKSKESIKKLNYICIYTYDTLDEVRQDMKNLITSSFVSYLRGKKMLKFNPIIIYNFISFFFLTKQFHLFESSYESFMPIFIYSLFLSLMGIGFSIKSPSTFNIHKVTISTYDENQLTNIFLVSD